MSEAPHPSPVPTPQAVEDFLDDGMVTIPLEEWQRRNAKAERGEELARAVEEAIAPGPMKGPLSKQQRIQNALAAYRGSTAP